MVDDLGTIFETIIKIVSEITITVTEIGTGNVIVRGLATGIVIDDDID
jgi:hypothetical protein